ncbi:MAG: monovalent cation/H(+) antiporter subunit G [Candidatus Diapherotrites archaeon]|uniref:Monovalent cation/H(+) antiporter subunit G n=1 Tax=Candidatus Iainarchaeum sp. TaxID=3101447 RepID=A0A938YX96_9ARCH|nr:monovalent cation/H(+) antiporter subunit G [Candidatus Diapherotrites archaeon]
MIWAIYLLFGIGLAFQALGSVALHRFPDAYTRLHGATKCTTFGSIFIYLGVMLYGAILFMEGQTSYAGLVSHTFLVLVLIMVTNPTGAHAIARAAYRSGIKPKLLVVDELRGAGK